MTDDHDAGPMPDAVRSFVSEHRDTGEPTALQLGKVEARLPRDGATPTGRRWLPIEALAAVVVVGLVSAGALLVRATSAPSGPPAEAPVSQTPGRALPVSKAERQALIDRSSEARKAGNLDDVIELLETGLAQWPDDPELLVRLGSAYASRAMQSQRAADGQQARRYYSRFLEVAPDDHRAERVRAILKAPPAAEAPPAPGPQLPPPPVDELKDLYLRGYQLRETEPEAATRLFEEVVRRAPADSVIRQKAISRLEELRLRSSP
jgi:tetratricopeptide (TPR) repeat protein